MSWYTLTSSTFGATTKNIIIMIVIIKGGENYEDVSLTKTLLNKYYFLLIHHIFISSNLILVS